MDNQNEKKQSQESNEKSTRIRAMIYPMAGFYMIYQAFCVYKDISAASGNQNTMVIVSAILLAIAGLGLMIFGFWIGYKSMKPTKKENED